MQTVITQKYQSIGQNNGQTLITEIGEKHEELSKPSEPDTPSEEQATVWVVGDSPYAALQMHTTIRDTAGVHSYPTILTAH